MLPFSQKIFPDWSKSKDWSNPKTGQNTVLSEKCSDCMTQCPPSPLSHSGRLKLFKKMLMRYLGNSRSRPGALHATHSIFRGEWMTLSEVVSLPFLSWHFSATVTGDVSRMPHSSFTNQPRDLWMLSLDLCYLDLSFSAVTSYLRA